MAAILVVLAFNGYRLLYGGATVWATGVPSNGLAVSPDGRTVYLASSSGAITPVSTATGMTGRAIKVSGGAPGSFIGGPVGGMAVTPDGRTLFATVYDKKSGTSLPLARVDLQTGQETGQVQVPGGAAFGFVLSQDGRTLYVASGGNELYAVSAATGRVERRVPAPQRVLGSAIAMVLAPDERTLYVGVGGASDGSGRGAAVVPVNLTTGVAGRAVSVGWDPVWLAVTPDGRTLYAAVDGMDVFGQSFPNRIVAIDTTADRVSRSVPWKVPPQQLAMAPDGATVWVMSDAGYDRSTADDTVTPLSVASGQPGPSIHTAGLLNSGLLVSSGQDAPAGMMLSPDGRRVYVAVPAGLQAFSADRSVSWVDSVTWPAMLAGLALFAGALVLDRKRRKAAQEGKPKTK